MQWAQVKHYVENELAGSAGWDLTAGQKEFEDSQKAEKEKVVKE
jgi:hypothetical protein